MARRRRARRGSWKLRQSGSKAQGCFSLERLEDRQLLTATGYEQINLVSDQSGSALLVDPKLINPYGIAIGSGASDFWVADAGSNSLTRYNGAVSGSAFSQSAISISTTPNAGTGPTGLVSNPTSSFVVDIGNNQNAPAPFIFATRNGQLGLVKTLADTQASAGNNPASGSFYTGLALVSNNGVDNLYAANFVAGTIVKFGTDFSATTAGSAFQDSSLASAGYAPYNIQVLTVGGAPLVFVTYAKQDSTNHQNIASDTHGAIDVFGLDGTLKAQLIGTSDTHLNAPWGLAIAPNNYGDLSGDLLVANGDGTVQAYSLSNVSSTPAATYVDALKNSSGAAIQIDGLHGLAFGNATSAGDANKLFFSAGGSNGAHGLFGELVSATNAISAQGTSFTATQGTAFNGVVAAFTPQAGLAGDTFTATINWGDGTTSSSGTIASNGSGGFLVSGSHTYAIDGAISPITVTINDSTTSGNSATATLSALVIENDLNATATPVSATEGTAFNNVPVAIFTDPSANATQGGFTASINWGDGTTATSGQVIGSNGTFTVQGSHTYATQGAVSGLIITISEGAATPTPITITGSATVADADTLIATATPISTTEGATFSGQVATFTDSYTVTPAGSFTATINWGDGFSSVVTPTGANGQFTVSGTHVFTDEGSPNITVSIVETGSGATASASSSATASVAEGDTFTPSGVTIDATAGSAFTGVVATFTDSLTTTPSQDLSATIDWGDGTTTDVGNVTGASGTFTVDGTHTYASFGGPHAVTIVLHEKSPGAASATATSTAFALDSNLTGTPTTVSATEGTAIATGTTVATFTDANTNAVAGDFTATIDWGDGTSSSGGSVTGGSGTFTVSGGHTYAHSGNFTVRVTVFETATPSAQAAVVASSAAISGAPVQVTASPIGATEGSTATFTNLATFTIADTALLSSDFTATIDWGDGHTSQGNITGTAGSFTVGGSHLYLDEAPGTNALTMKVTISENAPLGTTASATALATVAEGDVFPTGSTTAGLSTQEGTVYNGPVATFNDSNTNADPNDFTAVITWGDGSVTAGTVSGTNGHLTVSGSHTYADDRFYALRVDLVEKSPSTLQAVATGTATVSEDSGFSITPVAITGTEGQTLSGVQVATFTDVGSSQPAGNYTATIDWGDGSSTSTGTITGSGGTFTVAGTHAYANEGPFHPIITISESNSPAKISASGTATMADADVLTATGTTISTTTGATFTGTVATFTDAFLGATKDNFTVTIDWGDGTSASSGSVTGSNGTFTVTGSHVYASAGSDTIKITIKDTDGTAGASATSTAQAANTASISGRVFNDVNVNGKLDAGEAGLAGRTVFLNIDGSGAPDSNNPSTTTDANGNYTFSGLAPGNYTVMEVISANHGVNLTTQVHAVPVAGGQAVTGVNLGNALTSTILPMPVTTTGLIGSSDPNTAYINAVYQSILGHEPDAAGLAYWQQQMAAGASRSAVAQGVWDSTEHRGMIVEGFYHAFLGRVSDPQGKAYWIAAFDSWGAEQIEVAGFVTSKEYQNLHSGHTNFVNALYNDIDLRPADPAGASQWVSKLDGGEDPVQVAFAFIYGQEASTALVNSMYSNFLHRAPDSASLQNWVDKLSSKTLTAEQVGVQILATDEFFNRVSHEQAPSIASAASTTFTAGSAGSFTVATSGSPNATLSETGALPSGVTFVDNGDGTATLAGTPAAGTSGTFPITIKAANGISPDATQSFTLTVNSAPTFTSAVSTSFTVNTASSFTVSTSGLPHAALSETGALPSGLSFVDNGDGTAKLSGTPAAGTSGTYTLTITAHNSVSPDATQTLTLTVNGAPTITSAANTTFTVGSAGSFTVATSGLPHATLTKTGALPSGVTFVDNGDGTATLAGTPAAGTGGTYTLTITAHSSISPDATQTFTLTVNAAPTITSAANTSFAVGSAGSFTVTTSGSPHAALTETGSLPGGVTFVDNGDGTGTLSGTPAAGTSGTYTLTITANNGVTPNATQTFTLTVNAAPAITSAANATLTEGSAGSFTVTTSGSPHAALTETGSLPGGVTFVDNGDGTATLAGTPAAGTSGTYTLTITATNGVSPDATQTLTLTVNAAPAFTSADNTTFVAGTAQTFNVSASGFPTAAISTADTLPSGVTLTDNGNGTATLAMDSSTAAGVYTFTIKAANGVSPDASQTFTLTVSP